jgi:hypothetical protein
LVSRSSCAWIKPSNRRSEKNYPYRGEWFGFRRLGLSRIAGRHRPEPHRLLWLVVPAVLTKDKIDAAHEMAQLIEDAASGASTPVNVVKRFDLMHDRLLQQNPPGAVIAVARYSAVLRRIDLICCPQR